MSSLDRRYDFVLLFDVRDGNPNGDPDAGNMPRFDPETGQGLVTDVCLKRKIRNYVELTRNHVDGYGIYIREGTVLNRAHKEVLDESGVQTRKVGTQMKPATVEGRDDVRNRMCQRFFDVRTFGAVMSTEFDVGQVRGPVQLTFARSIEPVFARDVAITRMAVTNEQDVDKERTIGRKHMVAYGLYCGHGFISASLARKTGFSTNDLDLLWEALLNMFEHDRSAARGLMSTRRLIVFEHSSALGNAPAHALFDRVKIKPMHEGRPARSFDDYRVCLDGQEVTETSTTVPVHPS